MKRTTYIIAGMLLAGLLAVVGTMLYMSINEANRGDYSLEIGGTLKTVQLPECKVVHFFMKVDEADKWITFYNRELVVQPTDLSVGNFTYADGLDSYMSMMSNGDTLRVMLDFSNNKLDEKYRKMPWIEIIAANMKLGLPATVTNLSVKVAGLATLFTGFNRDSLSFQVQNTAKVKDSHFRSLTAKANYLELNSGEVKDLYLNLDFVSNWSVKTDSFHIDTEHLSGSHEYQNVLQKGECRQVLWEPLTENASLNLKLNQASRIEVDK